jgi:hypothetical protein
VPVPDRLVKVTLFVPELNSIAAELDKPEPNGTFDLITASNGSTVPFDSIEIIKFTY